ncbi:MAG: hypothetical protein LBG05_03240 [Treponema sp.]|jgi:hypothetical protein|nr:hypothetical protein [Treponema sp.]
MRKDLSYAIVAIFTMFFSGCNYYQPEEKKTSVSPIEGLTPTEETLNVTDVNFPKKTLAISPGERQKLDFETDSGKTITLNNLSNNTVYLVKVNHSAVAVNAPSTGGHIHADNERSVSDTIPKDAEDGAAYETEFVLNNETFTRTEHRPAQEFNRNPRLTSSSARIVVPTLATLAQVGDIKQFWVQNENDKWIQIDATLRATSVHSNVWVSADNFRDSSWTSYDNKITIKQAQEMADKFDIIYEKETPLFGYEFGGGLKPTDVNYGGIDGDVKVQILIYDINYDYSPSQNHGTFGYFWGKDYYDSGYHSNSAEMFYIDAHFTDAASDGAYSTLAHEFQHMINFNEKNLKKRETSMTWFDEMLSQIAEDVVGWFIGINIASADHPVNVRIPRFLASYWKSGATTWLDTDFDVSMNSYANTYAFGAYLVRNFGGATLIKDIMENDFGNIAAINVALKKQGSSFQDALAQYGEALVFSDDAHGSFNKTVTQTVNGVAYSFTGFNLWNIRNYSANQYYGNTFIYPAKGPVVIDTGFISTMEPYSILVQSCANWKNVSGTLSFELQKPESSEIDFYIIVK